MQIIALWQDAELIYMAHTVPVISKKVQRLGAPVHCLSCVGVNFMTSQYASVCICNNMNTLYVYTYPEKDIKRKSCHDSPVMLATYNVGLSGIMVIHQPQCVDSAQISFHFTSPGCPLAWLYHLFS